jgi:hypothetical protein
MSMDPNQAIPDVLKSAVLAEFYNLIGNGFEIVDESVCETPTTANLELVGSQVALRFSVDIRDPCVALYVTKAVNGRAGEIYGVEYFCDLIGYLEKRGIGLWQMGVRDIDVTNAPLDEIIRAEIKGYATLISRFAPAITDDSETFENK